MQHTPAALRLLGCGDVRSRVSSPLSTGSPRSCQPLSGRHRATKLRTSKLQRLESRRRGCPRVSGLDHLDAQRRDDVRMKLDLDFAETELTNWVVELELLAIELQPLRS